MKVLLVCSGGMSTSILMKKMEKYASDKGIAFEVAARGVGTYGEIADAYDIVLIGPQIAYRLDEIRRGSGKPTAAISAADYGIGNCEHIFALINDTLASA